MYYIDDLTDDVTEKEASDAPSRYDGVEYEVRSAAAKPAQPANLPRKYGPEMVLHAKGSEYKRENKPDKDGKKVEYTELQERILKYKVGVTGRMTLGSGGETLDTFTVRQKAMKLDSNVGAANIIPSALVRAGRKGGPPDQAAEAAYRKKLAIQCEEWGECALIWVNIPIDPNDPKQSVFYSNVCRPHAFHHSSLGAGREVLGAGEWIVKDGKLKRISANSGHYQPSLSSLHQSVLTLKPAFQPDTTVFLWNTETCEWDDVPVNDFVKDPTGGNIYVTHFDA